MVRDLTGEEGSNTGKTRKCVAKCYRGNVHSGVLWTVWTITDSSTGAEIDRFIGCDLLRYVKGQDPGYAWGNKSLEESSHPYYYSCPLGYLAMVPQVACEEWRKGVREYHAKRNKKLIVGQTYPTLKGLRIGSRRIVAIKVTSLKPLMGDAVFENGGWPERVKFSKRHIDGETPVPVDAEAVAK